MSSLVYDLSIAPLLRSLRNLDAMVSKAEAYVNADENLEESTLVQARLYPNMRPFIFQIRVATDTAKGAAARLSGKTVPSWPDEETTFSEVHERIGKAVDYLSGFKPEDFAGAEKRSIEFKLGPRTVSFTGTGYIADFVLPNFYFHMTTAYNILRHNGVVIGKRDYLGDAVACNSHIDSAWARLAHRGCVARRRHSAYYASFRALPRRAIHHPDHCRYGCYRPLGACPR